jgi:hypothetical protein
VTSAEQRAERLRVLLWMAPWLPDTEAALASVEDPDDLDVILDYDDEDIYLANACLQVEWELESKAHAALEKLSELIHGSTGPWGQRVKELPVPERYDAVAAVLDLGWVDRER